MRTLRRLLTLPMLSFVVLACGDINPPPTGPGLSDAVDLSKNGLSLHKQKHHRPTVAPGLTVVTSNNGFEETYDALLAALEANPAIGVVATLDHSANAERVGLTLPPTREIFFGNPRLGTPLMQSRQTTGIDLPQKMLIWEDAHGEVRVAYNAPGYLAARHRVRGARQELKTIGDALANLVATATDDGRSRFGSGLGRVVRRPGLVFAQSAHSADETFQRLAQAVENAGPLNILFTLEHEVNAAGVGLDLRPTKLLVFGNPALGTPLMQSRRSVGIDLPQKFLIFESRRGEVYVAYNDPFYVAKRHGIDDRDEQLTLIAGALANLANGATAPD